MSVGKIISSKNLSTYKDEMERDLFLRFFKECSSMKMEKFFSLDSSIDFFIYG
jgi:hypothetical protein